MSEQMVQNDRFIMRQCANKQPINSDAEGVTDVIAAVTSSLFMCENDHQIRVVEDSARFVVKST